MRLVFCIIGEERHRMPNRIIKESIWVSASLAKISLAAQAFFLRLLPLPDDHGCFDARTAVLRGRLYPLCLDKVSEAEIEGWMKELESIDSIRRWMTADGVIWGFVPKWNQHQRLRAKFQRKTPEPPEAVSANSFVPIDFTCRQMPQSAADVAKCGTNPNHNPNPLNTKYFPGEEQNPPASKESSGSEARQALDSWIEKARATHRRVFGKDIKPARVCLLAYGRNGNRRDCFGEIDVLIKFWESLKGQQIDDPFTWSLACAKNPETVNRFVKAI